MRVLRFIGKTLIVLFAIVGLLVVAGIATVAVGWRNLSQLTAEQMPPRALLIFDLADGVVEALPSNPLALAAFNKAVTMRDVEHALRVAATDNRVGGLLLHLGSGSLDLAHAQELADAVAGFRRSGKFVIAFAETFGDAGNANAHYLLATAANEIWLQPSGDLQLTGAALEAPFLRNAFDKLGVVARMDHREEYKGAVYSFTESAMPAPQRANMQALIDSWVAQIADAVARNRHIDPAKARQLVEGGPYHAAAAKSAGLIDNARYWDEALAAALQRAGPDAKKFALVDYIDALPDPSSDAKRIAVVYGVGPVVLGTAGNNAPYGGSVMASTTVANALHEAVDDPKIAGIILRVDSPGGSYLAADAIWREVARARQLNRPVVVSMAGVAASGGYFVAAPAAAIVAQPATITGSIGVFSGKFVVKDLLAKLGISVDGVSRGPNALADSPTTDYTPAQWALLETELDRIYGDFLDKVAEGRHLGKDAVRASAKGQIWTGAAAKERGLVDELGGFDTAVTVLRRLAKIDSNVVVALEQYPAPGAGLPAALARMLGASDGSVALLQPLTRLQQIAAPAIDAFNMLTGSRDESRLRAPLP
ncbi:MAG: protease [Rhodospirillaceae bacterium]|nr:protease [Rhodospirillaceae bacterium]